MFGIAVALCHMGLPVSTCAALTQFDAYMRPGELVGLTAKSFIAYDGKLALLLHPLAKATPGKTGEFDESIVLDQESISWLGPEWALLKSKRHPD